MTIPENIESSGKFQNIIEAYPDFYTYIKEYFDITNNLTGKETAKKGAIEMTYESMMIEVLTHFIGQIFSSLSGKAELFLIKKKRKMTNPNVRVEDSEMLDEDMQLLIQRAKKFLPTVPSEIWALLLISHGLDPAAEQWSNIGDVFLNQVNEIEASTDSVEKAKKSTDLLTQYMQIAGQGST